MKYYSITEAENGKKPNIIVRAFTALAEFIKSLWTKFKNAMNNFISRRADTKVRAYIFKKSGSVNVQGYNFVIEGVTRLNHEDINKRIGIGGFNIDKLMELDKEIDVEDIENWIRKEICGVSIDSNEDIEKALFARYRNGKTEKENISYKITGPSDIVKLNYYANPTGDRSATKTIINSLNRTIDHEMKLASAIENTIKLSNVFKNISPTPLQTKNINNYVRCVKTLSTCNVLQAKAELKAYADRANQYKTIVAEARNAGLITDNKNYDVSKDPKFGSFGNESYMINYLADVKLV